MDWINSYLAFTEGIPSPRIFREWAGIATVAAAMERRVWTETARSALYPNLFTLLVGPPGTGKDQAIGPARELLRAVRQPGTTRPLFHLAPDDITGAALVDALIDSTRKVHIANGEPLEYHSLIVCAPELGVLVNQYDLAFLSKLNALYENPRVFAEKRRHGNAGKTKEIRFPQLNILAGSQPTFMASLLPEEAWGMGFTSRLICIYAPSGPADIDYFSAADPRDDLRKELVLGLERIAMLKGLIPFSEDAIDLIRKWMQQGKVPVPNHSKLQHYNARRGLHLLKLCLIACASDDACASGVVLRLHAQRALDWLLAAEQVMPDMFRDMILRSDAQILADLHFYCTREHLRTKKPVHEALLIQFLSTKVPGEKVLRLLEIAERSDVLRRQVGEKMYLPGKRPDGVEE